MEAKTERFELRLEQDMLGRIDEWRTSIGRGASRSEAARRLMENGLQQFSKNEVQISDGEKVIMSMLHGILNKLDNKDVEMDQEFVLDVLVGGHYWALAWQYPGLFDNRPDRIETVHEVVDILDMWYFLEASFEKLSDDDKQKVQSELSSSPFGNKVRFEGFDGNSEANYRSIALFLVNKLDRFTLFKGREMNSHWMVLDGYRRMFNAFKPIRSVMMGRDLTTPEIIEVLNAFKS